MKIEISGFDKLQQQLKEAERALAGLDGTFATLSIDPKSPASIESAVRKMENAIDQKVGRFKNNPFVAPLIEEAKKAFRDKIRGMAAA